MSTTPILQCSSDTMTRVEFVKMKGPPTIMDTCPLVKCHERAPFWISPSLVRSRAQSQVSWFRILFSHLTVFAVEIRVVFRNRTSICRYRQAYFSWIIHISNSHTLIHNGRKTATTSLNSHSGGPAPHCKGAYGGGKKRTTKFFYNSHTHWHKRY